MREAKALASQRNCAGSPEDSLLDHGISTKIMCWLYAFCFDPAHGTMVLIAYAQKYLNLLILICMPTVKKAEL